jgi:hypothetical protein
MGYLGLEPRTYRLKAEYSTIELATLIVIFLLNSIIFKLQLNCNIYYKKNKFHY